MENYQAQANESRAAAGAFKNHKREGYLTWDEYFMELPCFSGMRPRIRIPSVGACIVSEDNKILSKGYIEASQRVLFR